MIEPLALLLIGYLLFAFQWVNSSFLPSPWSVCLELRKLLFSQGVYTYLGQTLYRMSSGYFLAILLGIPLLFPLFMLTFGIGDAAKIAIVIFSCSLLITVNILYGVRNSAKTSGW